MLTFVIKMPLIKSDLKCLKRLFEGFAPFQDMKGYNKLD